jgi:putative ABC transport system permease protein
MYRFRSFFVRVVNLFRRSRLEADLKDQIASHRDMIEADLISRGVEASEAKIIARRAVGNEMLVREFTRDQLLHRWIDGIVRDVRYALRTLARTPIFAMTVVLTLGLGIGANTAIFSIVDRLLLRPLPYPRGEQLVVLHESSVRGSRMDVNPANWLDWQRESQTFESFAAWTNRIPLALTGQGEPTRIQNEAVSYEFFSVLGVKPFLGREFTADDDRPQARPTVVLSHALWQSKFGGDPNVVGRVVQLDGISAEIIGVMPAGFHFLSRETGIWTAFRLDRTVPWRERRGRFLPYVVGRVKASVTPSAARQEIETIAARLAQTYEFNKNTSVTVIPLREAMTGEVATSLIVLFAAVGVLLLIACSNVANLLVARSANRRREIAVRTSLGAGRGAVVRQLLVESLVLSLAGGIAGVFIARLGASVLLALAPRNLVQLNAITIDRSMLLYTVGISLATGVLIGLAPATPAIRLRIAEYLRNGGRSMTASVRLRHALVVLQVAMTIVLLCGAGLLARTLFALTREPIGVDPKNVLTLRIELPTSRYQPPQIVGFFAQLIERLKALPGVEFAAAARDIPVSWQRISGTSFTVLGQPDLALNDRPSTRVRVVTPGYFKTLGMPLLKGRDFTDDDRITTPNVFIVNEAFARKFLPADDPLSASISVAMQIPDRGFGRIIGVVGDVKEGSLRGGPEPTVFYTYRQLLSPGMTLFLLSRRGAELAREAEQIVHEIDRNLPIVEVRMLEDAFSESLARERLDAVVSGAFAVCALLLSSLGLYGLLAFSVTERTNEIGIRMALGARASQVLRMILEEGLRLVLLGASLGLISAFAASRFLRSLLFGITAHDPATFMSVSVLLVLVTMIAAFIPARRATQVNPLTALRDE